MRFVHEIDEEEVIEMAQKKYAEYGECPYISDPRPAQYYGMIRTPEMREAITYKWDPETGVNMDPDEEFINPRRINRKLSNVMCLKDLSRFLHYAERVTLKHPGTKFWLCDYTKTEKRSFEYFRARNEWFRTHPHEYFIPDWILEGDRSSKYFLVGVCQNGEWRIKEQYCSEVEKVLPGGFPKNFHRVA